MFDVADPASGLTAPGPRASQRRPRLALVFPPFGPSGMPSLGLGLLSARVKAAGFSCQTFYWNFEMLDQLAPAPGAWSLKQQLVVYDDLTQRCLYPVNEWLFARALYGDRPDIAAAGRNALAALESHGASGLLDAALLTELHARGPALVERFADRLADFDVIGISSTFYQNVAALALCRHIKHRWPGKRVVLGGANVDGDMGPALFALFPFIDHIMQGEVDQGLVALLDSDGDSAVLASIPGLLYRTPEGTIGRGPAVVPESRLAGLPTPDYADFLATTERLGIRDLRALTLAMETSRGCWWGAHSHCTFCGLNANGIGYRIKDADRALAEMDEIVGAHRPRFLFMTDNIVALPHFDSLLPALAAREDGPQLFYEVKSNIDREKVRRLAAARVTAVQPGIESFSTSVLKLMRKGVTAAQNVAMLRWCREYGIRPAYNIIIGFPGENAADYDPVLAQLPRLWHLMPPSSAPFIEFHRFSPYHDNPDAFGITLEPHPNYRLLYPDAGPLLKDIAYSFVRTDRPHGIPDAPYLPALATALKQWILAFDWTRPMLAWEQRDGHVLITDERRQPGLRIGLFGFAATLLPLLDKPRSIPALLRESLIDGDEPGDWMTALGEGILPIAFSAADFRADPEACLALFADAGLVFVDDNAGGETLYVALPLPHDTPPMHVDWADSHV